ncbi:MAG: hypothetical protein EA370_08345 [Wenzhouxiangella sp.]|nr:MAG: hypothetical protein EA370_08345 [Wenzhouxiangella sp.]
MLAMIRILAFFGLCLLPPAPLFAQSLPGLEAPVVGWQSPFIAPGVGDTIWGTVSSDVLASVVWDDGDGPALYLGGAFATAGSQIVRGIARFDGSAMSSLGGGLDDESVVAAMVVFQGDLIVAGEISQIGSLATHNIARFDGETWHALGGGCPTITRVSDLLVFGGDLIVAGNCGAGQQVSRWDGENWTSMGANLVGLAGSVMRLVEHGGQLYAGGNFRQTSGSGQPTRVARWDGTQWQALTGSQGEGVGTALVLAMASFGGSLYVGGDFTSAGGIAVNRLARWDGADWHDVAGGVTGTDIGGTTAQVMALGVFGPTLVVGGRFLNAGSVASAHAARWDGSQWLALADASGGLSNSAVRMFGQFDGQLVIGGGFLEIGDLVVNRVALWDGENFHSVIDAVPSAANRWIQAVTLHDGELVIGGAFLRAGTQEAALIAAWNGAQWRALTNPSGLGLSYTPQFSEWGQVMDMVAYQGDLIVVGRITQAGGQDVGHVARWDGTLWHPMGSGFNQPAFAVHVHNGQLYAGGLFTASRDGSTPLLRVARWNGSAWVAVGNGFNSSVLDFATFNGELVAGGAMVSSGAVSLTRVARLDPVTGWQALGNGPSGTVSALAVYNGELIASGNFNQAGGQLVDRIARFNGSQWQRLGGPGDSFGTDPTSNRFASALAVGTDGLYATGNFNTAGGQPVNRVAAWTEAGGWKPLVDADGFGLGLDANGYALMTVGDTLVVAGRFARAGEKAAWNLAYWHRPDLDLLFRDRFQ